jgi:multidrug transporter EmrE-like cation transporter
MRPLLLVAVAILCNVAAQLAMKTGALRDDAAWDAWFSPALLVALVLYGLSFFLTARIYALYPLSIISPIMAGAIFLLVGLGAALLFAEPLTLQKITGIAIIVLGIAILAKA